MTLALFGTPGSVGGAATKVADLIELLSPEITVEIVINDRRNQSTVERFIRGMGLNRVNVIRSIEVSRHRHDVALGVCDISFFEAGVPLRLREVGIPLVWSNDMMWEFKGEREAAHEKLINRVIFVSEVQRNAFRECYNNIDSRQIPNFVSPSRFPVVDRQNRKFTIGRLSRPDPVKYPVDFPVFYEEFGLEEVRYRVQAWSDELKRRYAWHRFGHEWEFFLAGTMPASEFLSSLDVYVYPLGHQVVESWGRSTVEAMLTGCAVLVPKGHNFEHMLVHGESGFVCGNFSDFKAVVRELFHNRALRMQIGRQAAHFARSVLCNREEHRRMWMEALTF